MSQIAALAARSVSQASLISAAGLREVNGVHFGRCPRPPVAARAALRRRLCMAADTAETEEKAQKQVRCHFPLLKTTTSH